MKKKFLSLMMAAAMVATTSVSAFASSDATVTKDEGEVKVTITGSVNDQDDNPPEGTINVTIPTALAFTVNNKGDFEGTSLNVVNNGTEKVDVYAYQFVDGNGEKGINVAKEVRDDEKRNKVVLSLSGDEGEAGFASVNSAHVLNGIYNFSNPEGDVGSDGIKIASVEKLGGQNKAKLQLNGHSGKSDSETKAVREEFTLKLKVKKAN